MPSKSELSGTLTPRYFPCSLDIPLYNAKVCAHEAKKSLVSKRGLTTSCLLLPVCRLVDRTRTVLCTVQRQECR